MGGMFYKFVGGDDAALAEVFDKAVVGGSLKLAAAWDFNDPFEFKFVSRPPASREAFDAWHRVHAPERTADERDNAWAAFDGPAVHWNTTLKPRLDLLGSSYVLCLARRWDSHLMWGHYCSAHRGFVIRYKPEVLDALRAAAGHDGDGPVAYSDEVPELRWFADAPDAMGAILSTKSREWAYEEEYRVVFSGPVGRPALYPAIDPELIDGVILGARTPETVIQKAQALRARRSGFSIQRASSAPDSYALVATEHEDRVRTMGQIL